jgi:acetyl esterase/lipase
MSYANLASGYDRILTLHKFFSREEECADGNLEVMRTRVSRWVASFGLSAERPDCAVENHPDWRVLRTRGSASDAHVFFLHGGGLVFYSVDDYTPVLAHIAVASGATVTAFHYPRAPEHGFDHIIDHLADSIDRRLSELPRGSITLIGDSIGAYLALHLLMNRYSGRFSRLMLINPVLDLLAQRPSYSLYGEGYFLSARNMSWFQELCRDGKKNGTLDLFNIAAERLRRLPSVYMFSAEFDVLRDEALEWAAQLRAHGVTLTHHHFGSLAHDFVLYAGAVPEARAVLDLLSAYLKQSSTSNRL